MGNNDACEWRLYQTDLTTQLAILPFVSSHILTRNNEPGSGEVSIKLDAPIAASITFGQFCQLYYRGSARVGFFIDTLNQTDADASEGAGRMLSMSGPGALSLLSRSIVQASNTTDTTRSFTAVTKASILITLIVEAQARGELAQLAYDFSASVDSASVAWTDSETYDLPVGTTLLDVAKQFAETGSFDFTLDFAAGIFTLGAYSAGRGSVIATTTYFRIGENCEEVTQDRRGEEIYNVYYVKWRDGYITVSDATSISTYGRRVKFLSLEQAQSSASATTYAAAQLALTKDPKNNKTLKVYDGVKPRLWVDYDIGDTVSVDRFGTVSSDKILGLQADFDGTEFSHVTLDFNVIHYDSDLRVKNDLDWLMNQWATAHDGDLLEVSQGLSIGGTNGAVNTICNYGDYVYIGGAFTAVGNLSSSKTAVYQISTHTWIVLTGISANVLKIISVGSTIYACTALNVYVLSGTAWSSVGTVSAGSAFCMATDGTDLYVGGSLTTIDAVTINHRVAKRHAGTWSDVDPNANSYYTLSMAWFNGTLYRGSADGLSSALQYMSGGSFSNALGDILDGKWIFGLKTVGSNLIIAANSTDGSTVGTLLIYSWDGVSIGPGAGSAVLIGTITDFLPVATGVGNGSMALDNYLTDIYIGGDFGTLDSVAGYNNIAKYSGGLWFTVGGGVSTTAGDGVTAIELVNTDVYAGGIFTTAFGINTIDLSLFVTDFQSMLDHALNDPVFNYDLGAAIHAATAAAIADAGEVPFWDSVTSLLRKITWANIKTTLKAAIKLDEWAATTDVTTLNASTSAHGLLVKATAPAANVLNVVGIANGETAYTNKTVLDSTNPANLATAAAPGTSLVMAHRDHAHSVNGGWVEVSDAWAYASASTITIPTDGTTVYQKGWALRWKQGGGYKYGNIKSLTATVITIVVNTDHVVSNSAITDVAYSLDPLPYGFPTAFNFSSTVTYLGGTTDPTSTTVNTATYAKIGGRVFYNIKATVVIGTGNRTYWIFSVPMAPATVNTIIGMHTDAGGGYTVPTYVDTDAKIYWQRQITANGGVYAAGAVII